MRVREGEEKRMERGREREGWEERESERKWGEGKREIVGKKEKFSSNCSSIVVNELHCRPNEMVFCPSLFIGALINC